MFPRTANLILKKHIVHGGGTVAGEEYVPLGGTDFSAIVNKIQVAKPDVIFNTLNGDSNVSFFKQMAAAGLPPKAACDVIQYRGTGSESDGSVTGPGQLCRMELLSDA